MNHEIKNQDKMNLNIRKFEPTDPAHADVLNEPIKDLVNNDAFIDKEIEKIKQSVIDVDAINEASGNPILLTDSAEGVLADFIAYGRSEQVQYSGKNLLEYPYYETSHKDNGITWTDNGDGTVAANGTATANAMFVFTFRSKNPIKGNYILNGCPSEGSRTTYYQWFGLWDTNTATNVYSQYDIGNGAAITITEEQEIYTVVCACYIYSGYTANNVVFKPMISVDGGIYEPYVGGVASPNPDYPQTIESIADGGYFDGELLQGVYSATGGKYEINNNYLCNKNMIPCKPSDNISLTYKADEQKVLYLLFYDKDKNYLSRVSENTSNTLTTVAPSNAYYFNFDIYDVGSTPQTAKHITVTINGKYALIVKSKGKNLIPYPYDETTHTQSNIVWTDLGDGRIKANGTANALSQFYFTKDIGMELKPNTTYVLSGCPKGGSLTTYDLRIILNYQISEQTIQYKDIGNGIVFTTPNDYVHSRIMIDVLEGVTLKDMIFEPMIRPIGTDDTYEPYKETVTYIPLNEPIRSSLDGSVSDVARLNEVNRKFTEVVFDGSDDEGWNVNGTYSNVFYTTLINFSNLSKAILCDRYTSITVPTDSDYGVSVGTYLNFKNKNISTLDEWKTYLQANPITVQYELAEPITESIEPVDIVTYDNVTHLTASDNADMWVEYYSNSSVGQRLAKTNEEMKAEHIELNNKIKFNSGKVTDVEKSVDMIETHLGIGSRNLLYHDVESGTSAGLTRTVNGNKSITYAGVSTGYTSTIIPVAGIGVKIYCTEDMILSGCPSGGSSLTYSMQVAVRTDDGATLSYVDDGTGVTIPAATVGDDAYIDYIIISFASGVDANGLTFYPMLRRASEPDSTYEPGRLDKFVALETTLDSRISGILDTRDVTIALGSLSWTGSYTGDESCKHYATYDISSYGFKQLLSVTTMELTNIRESDTLNVGISSEDTILIHSSSMMPLSGAKVKVRILGLK